MRHLLRRLAPALRRGARGPRGHWKDRDGEGPGQGAVSGEISWIGISELIWLVVWNMAVIFPNSWDDDPI